VTGTGSKQALSDKSEDRLERSSALKIIGLGLIVAGMLVFFFLPAGEKLGQERGFITIISAMVLAGLALIIVGAVRGAKNSK
jgi:hypothetical protein